MEQRKNALGIIEFDSIPVGYRIVNDMMKNIELACYEDKFLARNKYVAIFEGSYENVEAAISLAIYGENNHIVDFALIGNIHMELQAFIDGYRDGVDGAVAEAGAEVRAEAGAGAGEGVIDIAVVETDTFAACIDKVNQTLHFAAVSLIDINFGDALDGKCLMTLAGNTSNLMAAIEKLGTGELVLRPERRLLDRILARSRRN